LFFISQALICNCNPGTAAQALEETDDAEASRKKARAGSASKSLPACSVDEQSLLEAARAATTPSKTLARIRNAVSKPRASKTIQKVESESHELPTQAEEVPAEAKDIIGRKIGPFRFTPKQASQASGGRYGGWEVQCPFHRKNLKSGCRKWFGVCGPAMKDKQECVAAALEWCAAARRFSRQWMHLGFQVDYKTAAAAAITRQNPIFLEDLPVQRCKPDSELDASSAMLEGDADAASKLPEVAREIGIRETGSAMASSQQLAAPPRKPSMSAQSKRRRLSNPASPVPQSEESADNCQHASSDSLSSSESVSSICSQSCSSSSNSSSDSSSSAESSSDED
jgi:hypothetical protein